MRRVVLLDDEQLDLVIAWAEMVRDDVLHDFEDDDEEALAAIRAARLAP